MANGSGASTAANGPASAIELDEVRKAGNDFLDLTGEKFLTAYCPLPAAEPCLPGSQRTNGRALTPLRIAAELYRLGYPLAWSKIYPNTVKQVSLPRYPWQHQICWREFVGSDSDVKPKPVMPSAASSNGCSASRARPLDRSPVQEIRPDASPSDLGIDSLMTLELQEELRRIFRRLLSVETLLRVKSVRDLELLLRDENGDSAPQSGTSVSTPRPTGVLPPATKYATHLFPNTRRLPPSFIATVWTQKLAKNGNTSGSTTRSTREWKNGRSDGSRKTAPKSLASSETSP